MIKIDFTGKTALITGGTKGIGLAAALKLGASGARTFLTYKWGMDDFSPLMQKFAAAGAPEPELIAADVSIAEETDDLMEKIKTKAERIDFFISNVSVAQRTRDLSEYRKRSLFKTLEYSTWPMIEYTQKINKVFGTFPNHIIGISSTGPDFFYPGYDFVAAAKSLLELFTRYLSIHLFEEGSRVNIIRFGPVNTESFSLIFGQEFFTYLQEQGIPKDMLLTLDECGDTVTALCSGMLNAVNGQILTVDKGLTLRDNTVARYLLEKQKKKKT